MINNIVMIMLNYYTGRNHISPTYSDFPFSVTLFVLQRPFVTSHNLYAYLNICNKCSISFKIGDLIK